MNKEFQKVVAGFVFLLFLYSASAAEPPPLSAELSAAAAANYQVDP